MTTLNENENAQQSIEMTMATINKNSNDNIQ